MNRRPRHRLPRFGLLTLSGAMLLCVSGAGWIKFRFDLLHEEKALFAALSEADCSFAYRRTGDEKGPTVSNDSSAATSSTFALPDARTLFRRVEWLQFRGPAPRELVERAARLPYVREFDADVSTDEWDHPTEPSLRRIGFVPPTPGPASEPTEPLPRGDPVDGEEAERIVEAFRRTLGQSSPALERGVLYVGAEPWDCLVAIEGDRLLFVRPGEVSVASAERFDRFVRRDGRFVQTLRFRTPLSALEWRDSLRHPYVDARMPHEMLWSDLDDYSRPGDYGLRTDTSRGNDPYRVERLDDVRYRIDFPSGAVTAVVRSDLDWEPESYDLRIVRRADVPHGDDSALEEVTLHFRGELRREGERVIAASWFVDRFDDFFNSRDSSYVEREYGTFSTDVPPEVDLASIDAEMLNADPLPPPRELPWLRWYRVTFAISLALLGFVAVRNVASRFRRRAGEATPPSPSQIPDRT